MSQTDSSKKTIVILEKEIAPCGINCRLCRAYGRARNACPGCRGDDEGKPKTRTNCRIKRCEKMAGADAGYCHECNAFPCSRLIRLDNRYRTKYGTSVIDNLEAMRKLGTSRFIEMEKKKWACHRCGALLCVHNPQCPSCHHKWR